ncbi:hypothetical protein [Bacteriophage Eos]|nr:hypothetical protein [Bacteriophage Eos]
MKINLHNSKDYITKCVSYAANLDQDTMDDHTMQLVADIYRLAELAAEQHNRLMYVRQQLENIENIPGVTK